MLLLHSLNCTTALYSEIVQVFPLKVDVYVILRGEVSAESFSK